eukprot:Mycagemm_TRINITY_DN1206_c0_g1::TRINITY_DN1206_c0_g1_i1::g.98::m.98 type:complete len:192 gc:universal TRINITY_DN1206_c0_g1_i1:112-687(+)
MRRGQLIGVCGRNASGKTTVTQRLADRGFVALSLSDAIRDELAARKQPTSRENMIEVGNELRRAHGAGVLGQRVVARLNPEKDYVIDSVRHPLEVQAMRNSTRFFRLIAVEASAEVRFARLQARGRTGDTKTLEDFMKVEKLENNHPDPAGQQLDAVMELADLRLDNDTTEEAFVAVVDAMLNKLAEEANK